MLFTRLGENWSHKWRRRMLSYMQRLLTSSPNMALKLAARLAEALQNDQAHLALDFASSIALCPSQC